MAENDCNDATTSTAMSTAAAAGSVPGTSSSSSTPSRADVNAFMDSIRQAVRSEIAAALTTAPSPSISADSLSGKLSYATVTSADYVSLLYFLSPSLLCSLLSFYLSLYLSLTLTDGPQSRPLCWQAAIMSPCLQAPSLAPLLAGPCPASPRVVATDSFACTPPNLALPTSS